MLLLTGVRSTVPAFGTLLNSECTGGDILYSVEEIWCSKCSTVFRRKELVHYCSQEKGTGALLIAGEGNWCSTVFRRKKLEPYCSQGEGHWCTTFLKEKDTGARLFSRERKLVYYCSQGKKTSALLFRIREQVHYCYQESETGALLF